MGLVAVLWATAFAADNLRELQRARLVEFEPLLDTVVQAKWVRNEERLHVRVRNLGRGTAAGLEVSLWWKDPDRVQWFPHRAATLQELLLPGETTESEEEYPHLRYLFDEEGEISVVVEVKYRDALGRLYRRTIALRSDSAHGARRLVACDGDLPTNLGDKQAYLDHQLSELASELGIHQRGWRLSAHVVEDAMAVSLERPNHGDHMWHRSAEQPVYAMLEDVRRYIEQETEETSTTQEQ